MKVVNSLLFLFLSVFCLMSCDDKNSDITDSIPKIASMTCYENDSLYSTTSYTYDTSGRLVESKKHYGEYIYTINVTYIGDSILYKTVDSYEPNDFNLIKGMLNSKNQIISYTGFSNNIIDELYTCEYNKEGYLIKESWTEMDNTGSGNITYTILNGNIIQNIFTSMYIETQYSSSKRLSNSKNRLEIQNRRVNCISNARLKAPLDLDYHTNSDTLNFQFTDTLNTIGSENMGLYFIGKQSRNLVSSSDTDVFTYELDAKGRVHKQSTDDKNYTIFTYVE